MKTHLQEKGLRRHTTTTPIPVVCDKVNGVAPRPRCRVVKFIVWVWQRFPFIVAFKTFVGVLFRHYALKPLVVIVELHIRDVEAVSNSIVKQGGRKAMRDSLIGSKIPAKMVFAYRRGGIPQLVQQRHKFTLRVLVRNFPVP